MEKPLMSWDGKQRRWTKMYRGDRYMVTAGELMRYRVGQTKRFRPGKEETLERANAWWINKRAEIDGKEQPGTVEAVCRSLEKWFGSPRKEPDEFGIAFARFVHEFKGQRLPKWLVDSILTPEQRAAIANL